MNVLSGEIEAIRSQGSLSLVTVRVKAVKFSAIVIDTPDTVSYLRVDHPVQVIFKETEVIVGKGNQASISLQNKLPGTVMAIESSDLLSRVTIDTSLGRVTSVITTRAAQQLELAPNVAVVAMIKTNEVMLSDLSS